MRLLHLHLILAFILSLASIGTAFSAPAQYPGMIGTITQRLEPFDPQNGETFQQRYYIDTGFAQGPDAPVLYFLSHEGEMFTAISRAGYMMDLAKALGASFVALEHRYYGQSIPQQITELTAQSLKPLTVKNALSDYRTFEDFAKNQYPNLRGQWITIGFSYGASLSTWYRETYPDETVGAIAASPVLNLSKESPLWEDFIVKTLGPGCVHDFHAKILDPIEALYMEGQSMKAIKAKFDASDIEDNTDFLEALGMVTEDLVQDRGPSALCPLLNSVNPLDAFVAAVTQFDNESNIRLINWAGLGTLDPKASLYTHGFGARQWDYQVCTEIGAASLIPNDPARTIMPTSISSQETQDAQCTKNFGIHFTADPVNGVNGYLPPLIASNSAIKNVLIFNDADDPVSIFSVTAAQNQNPGVVIYSVAGAGHHQEWSTPTDSDPQSFVDARRMALDTALSWLR